MSCRPRRSVAITYQNFPSRMQYRTLYNAFEFFFTCKKNENAIQGRYPLGYLYPKGISRYCIRGEIQTPLLPLGYLYPKGRSDPHSGGGNGICVRLLTNPIFACGSHAPIFYGIKAIKNDPARSSHAPSFYGIYAIKRAPADAVL